MKPERTYRGHSRDPDFETKGAASKRGEEPKGSDEGLEPSKAAIERGRVHPSEIFSANEVVALIDACSLDAWGRRLRAYIAVLYRTGMDASEGLALRYQHLDLTSGQEAVRVPASRLRPRTLALDSFAVVILKQWLELRRPLPGEHVFCTLHGPTLGEAWASSAMRRVLRDLGRDVLGKRVNTAALRNTLTAELIVEQWPLPYIQTQLGLEGIWSFRDIFPRLGIRAAPQAEVAEIARARPPWGLPE